MTRTPVSSSNVGSIGYDEASNVLEVGFKTKSGESVYQYYGVPLEMYNDFMSADSKGSFFAQNIKGVYEYKKA